MITLEPLRGMDGKANTWQSVGLSPAGLRRFLLAARAAVGLEGEVHVLLADDATLRRLNRTFLGKDKATDVLSFPAAVTTVFFGDPQAPELAGDLAISLEMATRQAARFGHSLRDEVRVLLLHGLLHLAGFDHERDTGEMAARELELRQQLGLPASLIARSSKPGAKGGKKQGQFVGRKVRKVGARSNVSGPFDFGAHGKAVSTSAEDDGAKGSKKRPASRRVRA
jgi:probable rRNA maturation factor